MSKIGAPNGVAWHGLPYSQTPAGRSRQWYDTSRELR